MKKRKKQQAKKLAFAPLLGPPSPIQLTERAKISATEFRCRIRALIALDDDVSQNVDTILGFVVMGTAPVSAIVPLVEESTTTAHKSGWYVSMPVTFTAAATNVVKGFVTATIKVPTTGTDGPWTLP